MTSLDSNCLEIKDEQFFRELQSSLNQSGVISESLNASLNGVIQYLNSIHDTGLPFASVVTSDVYGQLELSNGEFQPPLPFLIAFNQPAGNISSELTSTYESLNTEMNGLKDSASSGISNLQSQLQLISQTRDQQLEALEKARLEALEQAKKEEERLALEKKEKQEAEDKAKAEAEEKTKTEETPPTGEADPEKINKEQPEAPATNPVKPEIGEELTIPKDLPQQEVPQEAPKAEDTTSSPPVATPAPSDSQQVKGGE